MVVTRIYSPDDLEAVKKKEELKRKLGVPSDPSKWTHADQMKVAGYFRSIGWPMAMMGCNPSSFIWKEDPVTNKALCMLYNELIMARTYAEKGHIKEELRWLPQQFKGEAKSALKKADKEIEELRKWNTVVKVVEENTGIKTIPKPQPKPSVVTKPVAVTNDQPGRPPKILPAPGFQRRGPPAWLIKRIEEEKKFFLRPAPHPRVVMAEQSQPEQKKTIPSWVIPLAILGGLYIISRRR